MTTTVRAATAGEIPGLVAMMTEFYAESGYVCDPGRAAQAFAALLAEPFRGGVWVMTHADGLAGYVVPTIGFSMEFEGLDAFVDDLFVRQPYRRQGLARQALDTVFAECRRLGVRAVHLEVDRNNLAAKALYARFGFRSHDRELMSVRLDAGAIRTV